MVQQIKKVGVNSENAYQSLDKSEIYKIKSKWANNFGQNGHWKPSDKGACEYITQSIVDVLRLYFNEKAYKYIIDIQDEDVPNIQVFNMYARNTESAPQITVNIAESNTYISELGSHLNSSMNKIYRETIDGTVNLQIEARDMRENDLIRSLIDCGLLVLIIPALDALEWSISCQRAFTTSAAQERQLSTDQKNMIRTISFKFRLEYMPAEFIIDDSIMTEIEIGNLTVN